MLKSSTPLLIAFMMLSVFIACKKKDPNEPVPTKDKCIAEKVESKYDTLEAGFLPYYPNRDYQFKKTFNPDGSISQLFINTPAYSSGQLVNGLVVKTGNSLFLLDSLTKDTVFRAKFDANGRVVWSHLSTVFDNIPYTYQYNAKGQLELLFYYGDVSIKLYYNEYGDVRATGRRLPDGEEDKTFYVISYDHSVPLKGATYDLQIFPLEPQILEVLGYFDLSPHYKITSVSWEDIAPNYVKYFFDQQINTAGYLTDYKSSMQWEFYPPEDTIVTHITWRCNKVAK